jgi:hypothetical protein
MSYSRHQLGSRIWLNANFQPFPTLNRRIPQEELTLNIENARRIGPAVSMAMKHFGQVAMLALDNVWRRKGNRAGREGQGPTIRRGTFEGEAMWRWRHCHLELCLGQEGKSNPEE